MSRRPVVHGARGAVRPVPSISRVDARPLDRPVRSSAMLLLNEELARARMREMEVDAAQARLVVRLQAARRWRRRAEQAASRARVANAAIV